MISAPARAVGLAAVACLLSVTAACGAGGSGGERPEMGTIRTAPPEPAPAEEPEAGDHVGVREVDPVAAGPCPYLDAGEVSSLNGEIATDVRLDDRVDPPACFFYGSDGAIQLTTVVHTLASEDEAVAVVDDSVPVDTSERADVDGGWTGGKTGGPGGALLAVSLGERVLVVQSIQEQSMRAQRIADAIGPRLAG